MKTTMKKTAAFLLVILLVFQALPAFAEDSTVSRPQPPITSYREKLNIEAVTETLPISMTLQLKVTEGYNDLTWSSDDEEIATVDENGLVTPKAPGKVRITAAEGEYRDSITIRIVGEKKDETEETPADTETEGQTDESGDTATEARPEKMIIIINGSKLKETYDGKEHRTGYSATSNSDSFDPELLVLVNEGSLASGTACGVYQDTLSEGDFEYNGPEKAEFVITNGWLQIKPAQLTIRVDDKVMIAGGEEPELTATVTGLVPGDDPAQIVYTLRTETKNGTTRITADYEALQGFYRITAVEDGLMTVIEAQTLYNIVKIKGLYYRLAKTQIWTEKDPVRDTYGALSAADYTVEPYDFTGLEIEIGGKKYLYKCRENAEAITLGANWYEVKGGTVSIVKGKIGALDGSKKPRWIVPEEQRYNDPEADSIHRDYEITLYENNVPAEVQRAYNFLSVDGSPNYYKLPTTAITAKPLDTFRTGPVSEGEYILEPYDFTNTVLVIDGVEYRYNDGSLTEYDNYYTVSFEDVQKNDSFNRNATWFKSEESWLDGAYEEYGSLANKTTTFHANYAASTHKAEERRKSISLTSDYNGTAGYVGEKITLTAHLTGFDGLAEGTDYRLEWQYKDGSGSWTPIPGAAGMTYTFTLNQATTHYTWRVVAIDLE